MTLTIPDWCKIGLQIEWKAPFLTGNEWVKETIIGYGYDGFFHQTHNCPLYYSRFTEFGKTIRLIPDKIRNQPELI